MAKKEFDMDTAEQVAKAIGAYDKVDMEQFRMGLGVEWEHNADPETDVVPDDDLNAIGKIAWAHLKELPDYYTRLQKMEKGAFFDDDLQ
jgi:hypothetical protein